MKFHALTRSIRGQLLFLVIAAVLPALIVIYSDGRRSLHRAMESARDNQLRMLQIIAFQHEAQVKGLHQLLATLALLPEIQSLDADQCTRVLRKTLNNNPDIRNIFIIRPDGAVACSGNPLSPGPTSVTGRKHFHDAVRSGRFSAGEYVINTSERVPSLHFSLPVTAGDNRKIIAVLAASLNPESFEQFLRQLNLSAQVELNLSDHRNILLYRIPASNSEAPGSEDRADLRQKVTGAEEEGTFFSTDRNGVRRLLAFKRMRLYAKDPPYLYIRLTIPENMVMKSVKRDSNITLFLMLLSSLLALSAAWFLGNMIVGRRIKRLVAATNLLGMGAMQIRSNIPYDEGEIGQLAASLDKMARQLELLGKERENLLAEYRSILQTSLDGFWVVDPSGHFMDANDAYCLMSGYSRDELLGMRIQDLEAEKSPAENLQQVGDLMSQGSMRFETRHRCKDGTIKDLEISELHLNINGGKLISFGRDITRRKLIERELSELALTDELTGLTNRRGFILLANQQIKISYRTETKIALAYADVDGMKTINDTYGHLAGDQALIDVAHILRKSVRSSDIVARLGGDEFVILSIEASEQTEEHILARLQENLFAHNLETTSPYTLSISFGITFYDAENPCSIEQLLERGDRLMYEEKQSKKRERTD